MKESTYIKLAKRALKNHKKAARKGFVIFKSLGDTVYIPVKNDYPVRVEKESWGWNVGVVPFIGY